jgi:UDP-glucuronate 4-epimerase
MPDRTVLLTGAAGFIGSHLAERLLEQGCRVLAIDNFCDFYDPASKHRNIQRLTPHDRFHLVQADIRDRGTLMQIVADHQPDSIVHLAAMAGVRPSIEQPAYYTDVNIHGTVNLLDSAITHHIRRVVFASSSSVYGNNPKVPFSEDDRVDHPISPYAATKKAGELLCHTYHHLHHISIACLRFFTVYGPRQRPDLAISKFLNLVKNNQPIPLYGDGATSRDYTYIDDILQGTLAALQWSQTPGRYGVFNLGGSSPVTLTELIQTIETVTGRKARIQYQPKQPGDVERTWADLDRRRMALAFTPKVSLLEGIARQWEWLMNL